MADDTGHPCAWCEGPVYGRAETCSDACKKIHAGTHWPTPVGPATHNEMMGWIEERDGMRREVARLLSAELKELMDAGGDLPTTEQIEAILVARLTTLGLIG